MALDELAGKRLLILSTTTGYQTRAFVGAAERLALAVSLGSDRCHVLEDPWRDGAIPLRFEDPEESARRIAAHARENPVHAIVALGDRPTPAAARACRLLGLHGHAPEAADVCRDKYRSRERLTAAGLSVPAFVRFHLDDDPRRSVSALASAVGFPCVLKPLALSASRGVIRANQPDEFVRAFERIRRLLRAPEVQVMREPTTGFIQTEAYVEGTEVAVEAAMDRGRLRVLALFDKPDALVGPFFEETLYITPSRLAARTQAKVVQALERAAAALGLSHGPVHAEFRVNADDVWVLEVAARPIGGLCSRALRLRWPEEDADLSLEEVLIRLALGEDLEGVERESRAAGVMMIPVPGEGILEGVEGVERALAVPGIEEVLITAKPGQKLMPLPEGSSYPGFIVARSDSPASVEAALRRAHQALRFMLAPALPVLRKARTR